MACHHASSFSSSNLPMFLLRIGDLLGTAEQNADQVVAGLAVTAAVGDPLANVRRTITESDSTVLATSKELDRNGVDASNLPEIQSHAAPRRFLAEETLQLGCCLFVDTAAHEIQDQWFCRSPPNLEHAACSAATPMPAAAPMVRSSGPNGDYERS